MLDVYRIMRRMVAYESCPTAYEWWLECLIIPVSVMHESTPVVVTRTSSYLTRVSILVSPTTTKRVLYRGNICLPLPVASFLLSHSVILLRARVSSVNKCQSSHSLAARVSSLLLSHSFIHSSSQLINFWLSQSLLGSVDFCSHTCPNQIKYFCLCFSGVFAVSNSLN